MFANLATMPFRKAKDIYPFRRHDMYLTDDEHSCCMTIHVMSKEGDILYHNEIREGVDNTKMLVFDTLHLPCTFYLSFEMTCSSLFSFWFSDSIEGHSGGYVL